MSGGIPNHIEGHRPTKLTIKIVELALQELRRTGQVWLSKAVADALKDLRAEQRFLEKAGYRGQ